MLCYDRKGVCRFVDISPVLIFTLVLCYRCVPRTRCSPPRRRKAEVEAVSTAVRSDGKNLLAQLAYGFQYNIYTNLNTQIILISFILICSRFLRDPSFGIHLRS